MRGFVFCAKCGQRYTAEHHPKKSKSYYHCNRSGDRIKCNDKYVDVWDLEEQVADKFKTIQFSQKFISNVVGRVEKIYKERKGKINKEKKTLYSQKTAIEKKRDIAEEKLFSGVISDDDFNRNKKKYREQIEAIQDTIYKLDRQLNLKLDEIQEIMGLVRNIHKTYVNASEDLKRLYLGLFWERFDAEDKRIVKAEPTKLIQALIEAQAIIWPENQTIQKPQLVAAEVFAQYPTVFDKSIQRRQSPPPSQSLVRDKVIIKAQRGERPGLNRQPLVPQTSALPIELRPP